MKKLLITKRLTALLWALVLTLMPMSLMADNTPLSVTVTFEVGSFVYEQAGNAFDGKPETKWCGGILTTNNTNAYVQVQLAEKSKLDYYYLYTGNDINYKDDDSQQQRNPKEWKLYAKVNEGDEWTLISHVTDAGLPTTVSTRSKNYKIDAAYQNIEYNYLKFEILQIEKGDIFEVGEICFIKCNHTFGSDDICTECGYEKQQDDDFVTVASASQMYNVLSGNAHAKVRLTQDIYLSDLGADFGNTFCSTFYGILDGDGHAIKGDHYADNTKERRNRCYLFTYSDGATFKNLTFKHIRKNSEDHHNQAIITSQAKNGCVFENITFENCGTWTNYDNAGSAAGWAENCTFKDITVKNSDFTTDDNQSGCVVGHAIGCTFTNIKVENCESTSAADFNSGGKSGGVAGRTDDCTISNVEILGCFIKTYSEYGGGVVGYSEGTHFTNCIVDDQSCVCVDGTGYGTADAGGIVGYCKNCKINNCINSALIAADYYNAGGIAGSNMNSDIVGCLNTGMVIDIDMADVIDGFYNKYKNKTDMTCITKTYQGKEYVIRKYEYNEGDKEHCCFGGIVGYIPKGNVFKCVNFGSVYCPDEFNRVCGIVGGIKDGTISDCLSDFSGGSYGICLFTPNKDHCVSINNCLNLTTYKDIEAIIDKWDGCSGENNYSLTTATDAKFTTQTTADKIESGEICALLGAAWEQNVGVDPYPTPTVTVFSDDTEYNYNYYSTTGSVAIKRTFDADGWYSLCLPFYVDATQTAEKFAQVAEFSEVDGDTYKFTTVDHIEAGKAYIVRVDEKLENPKFTNVTIAANVEADNSGAFVGVLKPTVLGDGCKVIGSGTTVTPVNPGTMKAFRAYFPASAASAKAMRFTVDDGVATSIQSLTEAEGYKLKAEGTFNLSGQKVDDSYRGIVVKNGKKFMNK